MSTRLDPWGSGAVAIATRNVIFACSVGLVQAHPLTNPLALRKQPSAGLGPVKVHPSYSGVGPRTIYIQHNQCPRPHGDELCGHRLRDRRITNTGR